MKKMKNTLFFNNDCKPEKKNSMLMKISKYMSFRIIIKNDSNGKVDRTVEKGILHDG